MEEPAPAPTAAAAGAHAARVGQDVRRSTAATADFATAAATAARTAATPAAGAVAPRPASAATNTTAAAAIDPSANQSAYTCSGPPEPRTCTPVWNPPAPCSSAASFVGITTSTLASPFYGARVACCSTSSHASTCDGGHSSSDWCAFSCPLEPFQLQCPSHSSECDPVTNAWSPHNRRYSPTWTGTWCSAFEHQRPAGTAPIRTDAAADSAGYERHPGASAACPECPEHAPRRPQQRRAASSARVPSRRVPFWCSTRSSAEHVTSASTADGSGHELLLPGCSRSRARCWPGAVTYPPSRRSSRDAWTWSAHSAPAWHQPRRVPLRRQITALPATCRQPQMARGDAAEKSGPSARSTECCSAHPERPDPTRNPAKNAAVLCLHAKTQREPTRRPRPAARCRATRPATTRSRWRARLPRCSTSAAECPGAKWHPPSTAAARLGSAGTSGISSDTNRHPTSSPTSATQCWSSRVSERRAVEPTRTEGVSKAAGEGGPRDWSGSYATTNVHPHPWRHPYSNAAT